MLQHAMMHTRGTIARPWIQGFQLGASQDTGGLTVVMKSELPWSGKLVFDKPRHRLEMGFAKDWPRMNTMPEWFTVEPDGRYLVKDSASGKETTHRGEELINGLDLKLEAGTERRLTVRDATR